MVASSQLIPSLQAPQLCVHHTLYGGKPTPTSWPLCSAPVPAPMPLHTLLPVAAIMLVLAPCCHSVAGAIPGPKTVGVEVRKWEQWTSIAFMSCVCCNLILKEGML